MPNGRSAASAAPGSEAIGPATPSSPQSDAQSVTGIPRYTTVDRDVAAGGQPSLEGLRSLMDRGCRAVLNLLPETDADPAESSMVRELGMAYLSLPVSAETLDRDTVARFSQIVNDPENRPLFIHDSTGSRTGALWYLHRIQTEQAPQETARREAAQIGLHDSDTELWLAIRRSLARAR
jgi:protein tyrosine phosphatase (PTP) superfamily phosphohydrolase (DUF442 family)